MPDNHALAAVYGANYYASWNLGHNLEGTRSLKHATFRRLLDATRPWLPPGGPVLDLGCATGFFLEVAAGAGFEPYGVDIAQYAIQACETRFGYGRFFCGEFEEAYFPANPDGRFSGIFMSDYIEHVRDPNAVLRQAINRLAPNGIIAITTPNLDHFSRRLLGPLWPHFKLEHLWYFSPTTLHRLLCDAGMNVLATYEVRKSLSLSYAAAQFRHYPLPLFSSALTSLVRILPIAAANAPLRINTGEVVVIARQTR